MEKYAVVGLGYVGLELALALGRHQSVFGYDINAERIKNLRNHVDQHQLIDQQIIEQSNVVYTSRLEDIKEATFFIVAVPTPAYFYEVPNLEPLMHASEHVGSLLKKNDLIVFESTVAPGTTEDVCIPILEKMSGLVHGQDFHVGYSPERINPGDPKHTLRNITKIISAANAQSLERIKKTYEQICDTVYPVSNMKTAEAVKIIENVQRDVNIALMNEFSKIMHALDLDLHEILEAAKTKWSFVAYKPGFVGGHCISIDPHYLAFKAKRVGVYPDLILTARKINDDMTHYIIQSMTKLLIQNKIDPTQAKIGIFGISYKENTNDLRHSLALKLMKELTDYGYTYRVHDPMEYSDLIIQHTVHLEPFEALNDLSIAIILVPHDWYRDLGFKTFLKHCKKRPVIIDLPNLFIQEGKNNPDVIYWNL